MLAGRAARFTVSLTSIALLFVMVGCAAPDDETTTLAEARSIPVLIPTVAPQAVEATVAPPVAQPSLVPTWTVAPTFAPADTPTATSTPTCREAGQVTQGRLASALAQPEMGYRIYLPPCYGQDGRVYPVLYMLPGNIHDDGIWDKLGLDEAAEGGIVAARFPPMIIVMPDGGAIANQTSGGPGSYEGVILGELIPFIESNYCAWPEANGRAIGGLSRGGYWSLEIAFRFPAAFASVGGHSAALVDTYAGPALDPKLIALSADLAPLRIYLDAGQNDWYLDELQILHDNLLSKGKDHEWAIGPGGHDEAYWTAHVDDYLAWYAAAWPVNRDQLPLCDMAPQQ